MKKSEAKSRQSEERRQFSPLFRTLTSDPCILILLFLSRIMKYAVISDIHSNLDALGRVLKEIDGIGVDKIVCLGDIVGYGANPNECVEVVREGNIESVMGNHDIVACGKKEFSRPVQ